MGLKLTTLHRIYQLLNELKSDQNGIETPPDIPVKSQRGGLKSDQNGIETFFIYLIHHYFY